ncbi:hypothetical protein, partial [Promicromonospora kroppenstedtii]|uniref:hypothetical protein n=1 Tax=Promicromonospora kroppenstedtii TaxID=440482 RepID=UPI001B7FBB58
MYLFDGEAAGREATDDVVSGLVDAVRDCLAPLKVAQVFDLAVDHVLRDSGSEALERLRERPRGANVVAEPDGYHPRELTTAVADLHPGWTRRDADVARLAIYRTAPVDLLARFGRVLHAASARA